MSFKRNVIANYVSQIYVTLIAILMVPVYLRYMGAEAYGLVGFFAMLQAWFNLLDMGLTPTMARETARFNGGASDAQSLRRLLRAMEGIFFMVAAVGATAMITGAESISAIWLKVEQLPLVEVQHAIVLMAIIVALRWICGLYRGAINGFERITWLSGFNISIATARFVLVIPIFIYVGASPTHFFAYQLVLAIIEVTVLMTKTYRLLPKVAQSHRTPWKWAPLRNVLKFSLTVAITGSIWVFVTQTDKLVLSKLLPLTEYAYFTLAVLVAGGVLIVSGPISGALLPRLSRLAASGDDRGVIQLYRDATQLVAIIAMPASLMLAFFAEQVLWAWTGDAHIARTTAPVLSLYAVGNGILAVSAFPYYLQFAKGDLRLHLIGNGIFVSFLIPSLIWATKHYGVIGAGWAWLTANAIYFLAWTPLVHRKFAAGLHTLWIVRDLTAIVVVSLLGVGLFNRLVNWPVDRIPLAFAIALASIALLSASALSSSVIRNLVGKQWRSRIASQGQ